MINSRKLEDLLPVVKQKAILLQENCEKIRIDIIFTSTYRDTESQNELYKQGRTLKGKIVTKAKGGESFHQYKVAFDVVPIVNGKADWNTIATWKKIGKIGTDLGLEWAGNWKTFKEMPHFQYTQGLTIQDFKDGKTIS